MPDVLPDANSPLFLLVASVAGGIVTLIFREGFPAILSLLKFRSAEKKEERAMQAELAERGYGVVIAELRGQVTELKAEVKENEAHIRLVEQKERECVMRTAVLESDLKYTRTHVDSLEKQLAKLQGGK